MWLLPQRRRHLHTCCLFHFCISDDSERVLRILPIPFSIAGPRVWNTLPASVRDTNSSLRFRKLLKAFLFLWRPRRRWRWTGALKWTYLLTYLLTYRLLAEASRLWKIVECSNLAFRFSSACLSRFVVIIYWRSQIVSDQYQCIRSRVRNAP